MVRLRNLHAIEPAFWRASCNDQGDGPFRQMRIGYPMAPSSEASGAEVTQLVQRLQSNCWTTDSEFKSHGTTLKKNGVVAVFGPQGVVDVTQGPELFGECRDVPATKENKGNTEIVTLAR